MTHLLHTWMELPVESPLAGIDRRRVIGEQAMISHITLKQGTQVPAHSHSNEQFAIVVSGLIRFELEHSDSRGLESIDVRAGQVLHLPADLQHAATALEDTVILDVFSPPSESTGIDE
ncbi:MAG: cupin domain-containing protein [Planctomycetaceae bacterium]